MDIKKEYYARWKQSVSKPTLFCQATLHLSEMGKGILCGIDKRHPDIYPYGFDALTDIHGGVNICKSCIKSYNKINAEILS